jgi:predicted transcriptional regulator
MRDLSEIKNLRKKASLTQQQLAKLADVSQSLIAKLESGRLDPSYNRVKKIFDALEAVGRQAEPRARDFMTKNIICVNAEELAIKAAAVMKKTGISQLPVLTNEAISGMITESTVLNCITSGKNLAKILVKDVMEPAPPTIPQDTPIKTASMLLQNSPLVIVMGKSRPIGLITKASLLDAVNRL